MEPTARELYKHIKSFNNIYNAEGKEVNPLPKDVKVTVYCKGNYDEGFIYDILEIELGLEALIAKKWILQTELEKLL